MRSRRWQRQKEIVRIPGFGEITVVVVLVLFIFGAKLGQDIMLCVVRYDEKEEQA